MGSLRAGLNPLIARLSRAFCLLPSARKWNVSPLAPEMYEVRFTADQETVDALKLLQELLSHKIPNGDPAVIIKDSLLLRLEQVNRQKFGKGVAKRKSKEEVEEASNAEGGAKPKKPKPKRR